MKLFDCATALAGVETDDDAVLTADVETAGAGTGSLRGGTGW